MSNYNLEPRYDSQKSFYGKARVTVTEAIHTLTSYSTKVAEYDATKGKMVVHGWWSNTTARHVNEFLRQHGFETKSKKEVEDGLTLTKK